MRLDLDLVNIAIITLFEDRNHKASKHSPYKMFMVPTMNINQRNPICWATSPPNIGPNE